MKHTFTFKIVVDADERLDEYVERKLTALSALYESLDKVQERYPELTDFWCSEMREEEK